MTKFVKTVKSMELKTVELKEAKNEEPIEPNKTKTGECKQAMNNVESKIAKTVEVRGMPKCGRFWKTPKTKFSSINKTKGLKLSFERKQKLRDDIKKTRELSRSLINKRKAENEARKERRRENIKRRVENQRKSEVVQLIKNPAKIKRMRKKALRQIEKRDTLNMK